MNARTAQERTTGARRLVVIVLSATLLAAVLLPLSHDRTSDDPPGVTPLRVTSGGEIATGFAVGGARVVTVAHVLESGAKVDGTPARILRIDRRSDLALLAVPGITGGRPAPAGARAGDELRIVRLRGGDAASPSVQVRRPIVARVHELGAERVRTRRALELAGRVEPGDSGAPVVSRSGELAGVIFAASTRREDTAYAVDARSVTRLLAGGQ
jgi:S1-C subfamily serine protease